MLLTARGASGEKYLSLEEALRVCFPEATQTEAKEIVYAPEHVAQIRKLSGVKPDERKKTIWIVKAGNQVAGYFIPDQVIGKHNWIDYAVALNPDGKVRQIEILEYRESHGSEVREAAWRRQFVGKDLQNKLRLFEDITNITGATLSCRHLVQGVRKCLALYQIFLK